MGKDSAAFLEVMKEEEEDERGDEFELSLELSIGGRYAKSETNSRGKSRESFDDDINNGEISNNFEISRSGFCCGVRENGIRENGLSESADLVRRREVQALRRQEARKKREEKLKKSRGPWNGVVFAEDRLFLEAQRSQGRAVERESRERDGFGNELKLSLLSDNNIGRECLAGKIPSKNEGNVVACRSWVDCDSEYSNGIEDRRKTISNRSLDQTSSALSDYQSTSQKGASSSGDTGTLSSPTRRRVSRNAIHPVKVNVSPPAIPELDHRANNNCSTSENRGLPPSSNNDTAAQVQRMPCVSATGNGPNGRTVIGFLYNYTQAEVSIRCACHGRLFSPTEFVEHAGGVDVTHPLRHITMISYS